MILFYTTCWSSDVNPNQMELPDDCELTTDRSRYAEAEAVVFHIPTLGWLRYWGLPKKLPGQLWIAWCMECEENYPLLNRQKFMRAFDLTMTYKRSSDIFSPYFAQYGTPTEFCRKLQKPAAAKDWQRPVTMFISSRINRSERLEYASELMHYVKIDSYGKMLNNCILENDQGPRSKLAALTRYPFTIAFENAIGEDYVTEKFFDPLVAGSVPIYLGAPNIEAFAPGDNCFIAAGQYPKPKMLADYLNMLLQDESAYATYFAWKQKPLRAEFLKMLAIQEKDALIRLCEEVQKRRRL